MKHIIVLLIALAFGGETTTDSTENPTEGSEVVQRVAYGDEVSRIQFAYHVGIYFSKRQRPCCWRCGGALISSTFVVTTASCTDKASKAIVILGSTIFEDPVVSIFVSRENFIEHERYVQEDIYNNNIALIKIPRAKFGPHVNKKRMRVPFGLNIYFLGNATVSGYGEPEEDGASPLKTANLQLIETEKCPTYRSPLICGMPDNNTNIVTFDIGSPMVSEGDLIGVVVSVAPKGQPLVFSCLEYYSTWIAEYTGIVYSDWDFFY